MEQTLEKKYLSFEDDVKIIYAGKRIYLNKDLRTRGGDVQFVEINKTSVEIIKSILRNISSPDIVESILADMKLLPKYSDIIEDFIEHLYKKKFIKYIGDKNKVVCSIKEQNSNKEFFLTHATIELTDKCNLMCKHCYMSACSHNTNFISFDSFTKICENLIKQGVFSIELTGGEVFENPEFDKIIEYALAHFSIIGVLTNGTRNIEDNVLELMKKARERIVVSISIDSVNPDRHDNFRGCKGAWEKSVKTIKRLVNNGIKVRVASSIFEENMWEIDKLAEMCAELGVEVFSYNFIEDFGRGKLYNKEKILVKNQEYISYIQDVIERYKNIIQIVENDSLERSRGNCGSGTASIAINAKKEIRPCVLAPMKFTIGKISEDNELEYNNNILDKISKLKAPSLNSGCRKDCKFYYKCRGCYIKALNVNKENGFLCEWVEKNNCKELLEYM